MTTYLIQANGSVGFPRWSISMPFASDDDAIAYAQDAILSLSGARGFMYLLIWNMKNDSSEQKPVAKIELAAQHSIVKR